MAPDALYESVAIVGVGLIGGSIGRTLKTRRLAREVVGIGRHPTSLQAAVDVGAVDRTTTDIADGVRSADLAIVCTPVATVAQIVGQIDQAAPAHTRITDAASTKQAIVARVEQTLGPHAGQRFVGSHPLAGDHRTGPTHARDDLFAGRLVIVTPTPGSDRATISAVEQFWQASGAEVRILDPATHDLHVAAISHLPHLLAAALAAATPQELTHLAATGWKDTTRVAAGDPHMWQQIFATNRESVLAALDRFDAELADLRTALTTENDQQLIELLEKAKRTRDALGN